MAIFGLKCPEKNSDFADRLKRLCPYYQTALFGKLYRGKGEGGRGKGEGGREKGEGGRGKGEGGVEGV